MKDTIKLGAEKVKMIAHRGLSGLEMENTNSAFVAAGNRSYFGIETDVHRTVDGHFIIIHDDNTKRVAQDELAVESTTYETLRSIRLCDQQNGKGRRDLILPSLAEYISICKKYEKASVLELKNHFQRQDIDEIIAIIREGGWLEHTIFISFDLPNMICLRERLPEQPAQFLVGKITPDWLVDTLKKYSLDLDIDYKLLTPELSKAVHDIGRQVNVWTVNTLEDAQHMVDYGVDYITTNIVE